MNHTTKAGIFALGVAGVIVGLVAIALTTSQVWVTPAPSQPEVHPGRAAALDDIARGIVRYDITGITQASDAELQRRAADEYGISVVFLGCVGMPEQTPGYSENYRVAVREHLIRKHGFDPVEKIGAEIRGSSPAVVKY